MSRLSRDPATADRNTVFGSRRYIVDVKAISENISGGTNITLSVPSIICTAEFEHCMQRGIPGRCGYAQYPVGTGADCDRNLLSAQARQSFFSRMGHVNKEIRSKESASSISALSRSPAWNAIRFPAVPGGPYLMFQPGCVTGAAHAETLGNNFPPSLPKMTGSKSRPTVASRSAFTPLLLPSRKSAHPNVPDLIIPSMEARIPAMRSSGDGQREAGA